MAQQISPKNELGSIKHFNTKSGAWYTESARHPFRYFIAAGATLDKIKEVIENAEQAEPRKLKLAQEAGAVSLAENYEFKFKNVELIERPSEKKISIKNNRFFSDITQPDCFVPNPNEYGSFYVFELMAEVAAFPESEAKKDKIEKLCRRVGAAEFKDGYFIFDMTRENIQLLDYQPAAQLNGRPSFILSSNSWGNEYFIPDASTNEGLKIYLSLRQLQNDQRPFEKLMKWLGCVDLNTDPHGNPRFKDIPNKPNEKMTGNCVKIGDEWIVSVPVVGEGRFGADGKGGVLSGYQEEIIVPPDSIPLEISDYFKKLEKAETLSFAGSNLLPAP